MTPYSDFLYFEILLYFAVPSAISGLAGRLHVSKLWITLGTAIMLVFQYWAPRVIWPGIAIHDVELVLSYAVIQWIVASVFLRLRQRVKSRAAFYVALLLTLLPLGHAKILPLTTPTFLIGFVGISFITFRSLDVIINMQDGLITDLPLIQYLAYLLFFPTISSGPVDRYRRFAADWNHTRTRTEFLNDVEGATSRIFKGLLYKFLLAALIKQYWMDPVSHGAQLADIVSYMYAYSFYLFFDFAGYSAFAIGISYLMGIHTPENFNRPFFASNIREFWDRWHISLSWWFRDHIYMRFVFAATKGKWFKNKYAASYLGYLLTMGLMGLWHGTTWYYILYGFYHGALLATHNAWSRWNKRREFRRQGFVTRAASTFVTFNLVCFGLLIFSGRVSAESLAPSPAPPQPATPATPTPTPTPAILNIHFGDYLTLFGYSIVPTGTLRGGVMMRPNFLWRTDRAIDDRYNFVVQLVDEQGHVWARDDSGLPGLAPSTLGKVGRLQSDERMLKLPPTMPTGEYQITAAVYQVASKAFMDARDNSGNLLGTEVTLGTIGVQKNKASVVAGELWWIERPLYVDMREMRFLGSTSLPESISPGDGLHLGIYWRARRKPVGDYVVTVQLRDTSGSVVLKQSARPANNAYPTTDWDMGEVLLDWHDFIVPGSIPVGGYVVEVVLSESDSGIKVGEIAIGRISIEKN